MMYIYVPPTSIGIPVDREEQARRLIKVPYFLYALQTQTYIPIVSVHDGIGLDSLMWIVYAVSQEFPLIRVAMIDEFREHENYRRQRVANHRNESDLGATDYDSNPE